MRLAFDNLDGVGAVDYSSVCDRTDHTEPVRIERVLNAPTLATGVLCLAGTNLAVPVRRARVTILSDGGVTLFTGYLTTAPTGVYAGEASSGGLYRVRWDAVSDEWLLDKQTTGAALGPAFGGAGAPILGTLISRTDPGRLQLGTVTNVRTIGLFEPKPHAPWSEHAGAVAASTYGTYRAMAGAIGFGNVGDVVHPFSEGAGVQHLLPLARGAARELTNDVTVTGAGEPTTFWTELFSGDGTTTEFSLTGDPVAPGAGKKTLIDERFTAAMLDRGVWSVSDSGSHLSLGASGLTLTGGNGQDGATTLTAVDLVELGGSLVFELTGVTLGAGSAGVVCGVYSGATAQANCVAGWSVRQAAGNTVITPMVNGAETGSSTTLVSGHRYSLRLRVQCPELVRVKQMFYASVAGAIAQFGGGLVAAKAALVFELRDEGASSNTPVTVVFDGSVASAPATGSFVAVNSVQLFGSIASVRVACIGSASVVSAAGQTGAVRTRLIGKAGEGVDCTVTSSATGKVTFFAGQIPAPGDLVTVRYRGRAQSVARLADPVSVAAEAAGGGVGTARWVGRVVRPAARTSEDCESASLALLGFSSDRSATLAGRYDVLNPTSDVWPGDVLSIPDAAGGSAALLVRQVTVEERGAAPEILEYRIAYANQWSDGLSLQLSEVIPTGSLLPATSLAILAGSPPALAPHVLASLTQVTVVAGSGTGTASSLTVDAGADPPRGGGFEVRRFDEGWGVGAGADVVLRSPVRGFSIPRAEAGEVFFVRMFDASTPPLYSRFSAGIVSHLPVV